MTTPAHLKEIPRMQVDIGSLKRTYNYYYYYYCYDYYYVWSGPAQPCQPSPHYYYVWSGCPIRQLDFEDKQADSWQLRAHYVKITERS